MDRKLVFETAALVLLFAAFPIISFGSTQGNDVVWWLGLLCLVVGGVLPVITRYMDHLADTIRGIGFEFDERPSRSDAERKGDTMSHPNGPRTGRPPTYAPHGVVSTPHYLASAAGLHALQRGGSA